MNSVSNWNFDRGNLQRTGYYDGNPPKKLKLKWKFNTGARININPLIYDGRIFVSNKENSFYSIDLKTKKILWNINFVEDITCFVIHKEEVYIGTSNSIYCFDVYNGDFVWEYKIKTKKFNFGRIFGIKSRQTNDCKGIIIKDNILVFADSEGFLNALNLDNGKEIWSYKIQKWYSLYLSLYNEKLFVGVKNNLYCLNIFNGYKLSKLNFKYYINTFISADNDIMYFGTDFNFYAIELNTNKVLWEHKIKSLGYITFESPAVYKDRIVLAYHDDYDFHCYAYLCCLNKNNGNVLWTYDDVFNFIHSGPVISNGCVYFGCENFHSREYYFCVLDLETGKELSRFETKDSLEVDPAFYDNMVVIGCDDGYLYVFE